MDPSARGQALASPASAHLPQRDRRSNPLPVAGQGRHSQALAVWVHFGFAARLPHICLGMAESGGEQAWYRESGQSGSIRDLTLSAEKFCLSVTSQKLRSCICVKRK